MYFPYYQQLTGQPVLIGGTMGTCSYVLTGTDKGMEETFGSTCHGAVSNVFSVLPSWSKFIWILRQGSIIHIG